MEKTAVSTKPLASVAKPAEHAEEVPVVKPVARKPLTFGRAVKKCFAFMASLKLTVILFVPALFLVFFGTLAQVDSGIWTVVNKYFRSAVVLVPFQIFFPRSMEVPGAFPFPGGWLLGTLLLVNLLAAHAVRFRYTLTKPGIVLIHAGVIIIMLSELITGMFAIESHMTIPEGKSTDYVERTTETELAVLKKLDPDPANKDAPLKDEVTVVPERLLRGKAPITDDLLPFDVEVEEFMVNSAEPFRVQPGDKRNKATAGLGLRMRVEMKPEGSGVDAEQKVDVPSAYITLKRKDNGAVIGTYFVSHWLSLGGRSDKVTVDGQEYEVTLRPKRTYQGFAIELKKFTHEVHPKINTPKNFASRVRIKDPDRKVDREVVISMNSPMTYEGQTYYQSSFLQGDTGTVLQVVRNPGWWLPYISFFMVMGGMMLHFGMNLVTFAIRRLA